MSVALCWDGSAGNSRRPRRNSDRGLGVAFGNSIVNGFAIIRAVCGQRCDIILDLIEQFRHFGNVADIVRRQFHDGDFMRVSINAEVQFAPAAARPNFMFLIQPLAIAIDLKAVNSDSGQDGSVRWRTPQPTLPGVSGPPAGSRSIPTGNEREAP